MADVDLSRDESGEVYISKPTEIEKEVPYKPYIPAHDSIPEITFKAIILSMFLSCLLSAANIYLGLFAGLTVSASIPAAVLSMALLKFFKGSTILENNLIQTAASAGESISAGVLFTIPALIIIGARTDFDYLQTFLISAFGGTLGVLFSIPLRRALLIEQRPPLAFPEGKATAEVLKTGHSGGVGASLIIFPAIVAAFMKLADTGLTIWGGSLEGAWRRGSTVFYLGTSLSPALIGVGYIVGFKTACIVVSGGLLNFLLAIPLTSGIYHYYDDSDTVSLALTYWSTKTRYIGCGAMVIGGLWALINMRQAIWKGLTSGLRTYLVAFRARRKNASLYKKNTPRETLIMEDIIPRTERDISMVHVLISVLVCTGPLFYIYYDYTVGAGVSVFMCFFMIVFGFLFSSVAAYMAGVVGSSNNPISGVTICTILVGALLLRAILGASSSIGPASAVLVASTVCCAAAISGDNMQDLKAGHILGATPWKQQLFQIFGTLSAAIIQQPVLSLLNKAYGIGVPTDDHPNPLAAPQSVLMAAVADGVFNGNLPWEFVGIGMGIAGVVIVIDKTLEYFKSPIRLPPLAVAMGIYLPFSIQTAIFFGGVVSYFVNRYYRTHSTPFSLPTDLTNDVDMPQKPDNIQAPKGKRKSDAQQSEQDGFGEDDESDEKDSKKGSVAESLEEPDESEKERQEGILFAGGLITGESLMGLFLALPIVISGDAEVLSVHDDPSMWPGAVILVFVAIWLYAVSTMQPFFRVLRNLITCRSCRTFNPSDSFEL